VACVVNAALLAWCLQALCRFREKRKRFTFEKKVRYQSRQRLATQRPRVRGQFVRQQPETEAETVADPVSTEAESRVAEKTKGSSSK